MKVYTFGVFTLCALPALGGAHDDNRSLQRERLNKEVLGALPVRKSDGKLLTMSLFKCVSNFNPSSVSGSSPPQGTK